jgi:hypothetical protein
MPATIFKRATEVGVRGAKVRAAKKLADIMARLDRIGAKISGPSFGISGAGVAAHEDGASVSSSSGANRRAKAAA